MLAFILTLIKALVFFSYFYFFFNGTYTSGFDDYVYITKGALLIHELQDKPLGSIELIHVAGSFHFLYTAISAIAQYCFGEDHYFSLVAVNVIASFICGYFAYAIIKTLYHNENLSRVFFIFMVMFPSLLSWSSVFAGKDTFVLLGHLIFIYAYSNFINNHNTKGIFLIVLALLLTINLRFYVAPFFLIIIFIKIKKQFSTCLFALALIILAVFSDLFAQYSGLIQGGIYYLKGNILNVPYNMFRFWLTPRPFFEELNYSFLLLANIFNWICFPIFLLGILKCIFSKNRFVTFMLLYISVFTIFYGVVDFLNGPRQRLQLTFAIIYFLWIGISELKFVRKNLRISVGKRLASNTMMPATKFADAQEIG
jgi:hypothetical protein